MTTAARSFAYARGEEVIAHLRRAPVYSIEHGGRIGRACVPRWTIACVMACASDARGHRRYLLRFAHDGADCVCWVGERAIEGVC